MTEKVYILFFGQIDTIVDIAYTFFFLSQKETKVYKRMMKGKGLVIYFFCYSGSQLKYMYLTIFV